MKLMDSYTDEEFIKIFQQSKSYADCMRKMGYKSCSGDNLKILKTKIEQLNLSTEHFTESTFGEIRTDDEIFCENSTVCQSVLRRRYLKKYPMEKCSICGQIAFWNNKPMTLILDHINGSNHDNRIENLRWVCPNCNIQLDTTSGRNINHKKYYCEKCGNQISNKNAKICIKCLSLLNRVVDRPNREELKKLIRVKSFAEIGRQFGVSHTTIPRWCKFENLPSKKAEIKSYSNEEWENV
jgi:hypothetical protein